MPPEMTDNDRKALALLARLGAAKAGYFGEEMSTSDSNAPPQSFARSGGKALNRLVNLGYAEWYSEKHLGGNWGWRITPEGRREARRPERGSRT